MVNYLYCKTDSNNYYFDHCITVEPGTTLHVRINGKQITFEDFKFS